MNKEQVKENLKGLNSVCRFGLSESDEVQLREAIKELEDENVFFLPKYEKGIYTRINSVDDMSKQELEDMEKYVGRELKKAITLIKRMRKLQKFTKSQKIKNIMGDLKLELMSDV